MYGRWFTFIEILLRSSLHSTSGMSKIAYLYETQLKMK